MPIPGVELIGVTAGEAENPEKVLPHATNSVTWRILIFYIGALIVIMSLVPWNELNPQMSPFVTVFEKIGIPGAAGIINFVVITAAASACNSGIFSTGRMLYTLAQFKQAPAVFGKVSKSHVPAAAITLSAAFMLVGVALNYLVPEEVFTYVTSVATIGAVWTWGIIVWAHLKYRQAVKQGRATAVFFRMPCAPWGNWFVLVFLALVVVFLGMDAGTRVALYVTPAWFALLTAGYLISKSRANQGAFAANTAREASHGHQRFRPVQDWYWSLILAYRGTDAGSAGLCEWPEGGRTAGPGGERQGGAVRISGCNRQGARQRQGSAARSGGASAGPRRSGTDSRYACTHP